MKKEIILSIFFSAVFTFCQAQLPLSPQLKIALQNKSGYKEIMKTVDEFYSKADYVHNRKLFSEYKKWNRWGWYMGSHLNADGSFADVSKKTWEVADTHTELKNRLINNTSNIIASNSGVWAPIGPYSISSGVGRADRLAFHPTNANIIYAGTPAGGLWKTTNGGTNWFALNGFLPNIGVSGIVIDRDDANTIYVLTGDGDSNISGGFVAGFGYIRPSIGILKSTDGGNSWINISNIVTPGNTFYGFKLVQSADFHNRFFACTSDGLYRSTDFCQTWSRDAAMGATSVYDVELGPPSYVYACTNSQVFVSANYGNPFVAVPNFNFPNNDRASLAVSANAPNRLYVSFGGTQALYRSDNNGINFTLVNPGSPLTSNYTAAMAASPNNANTLFIGNVDLSRSFNGGASFGINGAGIVHADIHDLQFNPLNNYLYAACDGGVYRSTDLGVSWFSIFNGMQITQFYHFTGVNGNNNFIFGGAQDNGSMQSADNAATYQFLLSGDGFESDYLNSNNNSYYYTSNQSLFQGSRSPFTQFDRTPAGAAGFYPSIVVHPNNDLIAYAGFTNGVFRTDNGGTAWINKGNQGSAGGSPAGGLAVSANLPDRIYAAGNTTLWRSDNKGDNWTTISGTPGWPAVSIAMPITDISTRSNNGNEIWITLGGYTNGSKVFYSSNGGTSWSNFSGSLPNVPAYCVKYTSDGDVYIGTDIGVFFMDFAMNDWVPFSNGLPVVPVSDLFINEINGNIRCATFGRGIWQSDLYSDCGPLLLLSGLTQGTNFYQSGGVIETTQSIPGSFGNSVKYRSPTQIIMKPGFSVKQNAYMHALIGNCGQGIFSRGDSSNTSLSKGDYLQTNFKSGSTNN